MVEHSTDTRAVEGSNPSTCTRYPTARHEARRAAFYTWHMRSSALILPIIVLAAVAVGGSLYLFGGSLFNTRPTSVETPSGFSYAIVAEGNDALGMDRRVNYRIHTADQFEMLWEEMFNGNGPTRPAIDFTRDEVLAVFNGTHSTSGYRVSVSDIKDGDGARVVTVLRTEPGEACEVSSGMTSPYIIIRVPKSNLPIERVEQTTTACL